MPDNDWKWYPSQLSLLFLALSFSVLYLGWPTVSVCLGLSWFQQWKFQVSGNPSVPSLFTLIALKGLEKMTAGEDFLAFSLKCSSQLQIFLLLLSDLSSVWCTWPPQDIFSFLPTTLFKTDFPDLLFMLSGWSKPSVCSVKDIHLPRHLSVHKRRVQIHVIILTHNTLLFVFTLPTCRESILYLKHSDPIITTKKTQGKPSMSMFIYTNIFH